MPGTLRPRALAKIAAVASAAVLGAGCAPSNPPPDFPVQEAEGLLVHVVDALNDAGRGASVAVGPDGTVAVSYLLVKPSLREGEIPPPVVAGQAQPPSVMVASFLEGIWTPISVTPQASVGEEAVGSANEIADADGLAVEGVTTSLAIDGQGAHHVVWSTPEGLFYATDAGGEFGEKEQISSGPAFGGSITTGTGGTFVSFYSGGSLRVAERVGSEWSVEEILQEAGPAANPATVTDIEVGPVGPVVAFGDDGRTVVATRSEGDPATGAGWATEVVGEGGYGISMDLDANGAGSVAYYDSTGRVRLAESSNTQWNVTDIDNVGAPSDGGSDARWSTGIAVDDEGTHHVTWADTSENLVEYATGDEGALEPRPLPSGENGTNPDVAVSGDGATLALALFDSFNANVEVATPPSGELALAHPTERPALPSGPPPAECEPEGGTELQIAAPAGASTTGFDKDCLAMEAGTAFTVAFANDDDAIPHNWTLYTDSSAAERLGGSEGVQDPVAGGASDTYELDPLDPGSYFFRCDFHPTSMVGTFAVPEG